MKKPKETQMREDYKAILKKHRAYSKFISSLKKYTSNYNNRMDSLNKLNSFGAFVSCSFVWGRTPEGYDYWLNIANQR